MADDGMATSTIAALLAAGGGGWRRVERQRDRRPFLPAKIDEKIILAVNLGRTYGPSLNEAGSSLA
jgi:hypothetical protein